MHFTRPVCRSDDIRGSWGCGGPRGHSVHAAPPCGDPLGAGVHPPAPSTRVTPAPPPFQPSPVASPAPVVYSELPINHTVQLWVEVRVPCPYLSHPIQAQPWQLRQLWELGLEAAALGGAAAALGRGPPHGLQRGTSTNSGSLLRVIADVQVVVSSSQHHRLLQVVHPLAQGDGHRAHRGETTTQLTARSNSSFERGIVIAQLCSARVRRPRVLPGSPGVFVGATRSTWWSSGKGSESGAHSSTSTGLGEARDEQESS